jgi:hypothetical protein
MNRAARIRPPGCRPCWTRRWPGWKASTVCLSGIRPGSASCVNPQCFSRLVAGSGFKRRGFARGHAGAVPQSVWTGIGQIGGHPHPRAVPPASEPASGPLHPLAAGLVPRGPGQPGGRGWRCRVRQRRRGSRRLERGPAGGLQPPGRARQATSGRPVWARHPPVLPRLLALSWNILWGATPPPSPPCCAASRTTRTSPFPLPTPTMPAWSSWNRISSRPDPLRGDYKEWRMKNFWCRFARRISNWANPCRLRFMTPIAICC